MPSQSTTLVLIDAGVSDYPSLINGVNPEVETILLEPTQDGVEQIAQILSDRRNLRSLHLFSHGSPGTLDLGTARLSLETLNQYADQLRCWARSLAADAEILLYGCRVALGDVGQAFIDKLATLTGAAIAASSTVTGNAALGGDWNLDVTTRSIASKPVLHSQTMATYSHILPKLDWGTLDWNPAGTGAGAGGQTFTNVDGSGVNVTVEVIPDAGVSFLTLPALPGAGIPTPQATPDDIKFFNGGYSNTDRPEALHTQIDPDAAGKGVTVKVSFSQAINNVSFEIYDIDTAGSGVNQNWQDQIVINGFNAAASATVAPTFVSSATPSYSISGNTLTGSSSSTNQGSESGVGTVSVVFPSPVTSFTLVFKDGPLAKADPDAHGIALLSSVSFDSAPPTTDDATIPITALSTNLTGLGGADSDGTVAFYRILSIPSSSDGTLRLDSAGGTLINAGDVIPADKITSLYFVQGASFNGSSFTYAAIDNSGAIDATPALVILESALNLPPDTNNAAATITPNSISKLSGLSGTDSTPGGSIVAYKITTLPDVADGTLYLGNPVSGATLVQAGQIIPVSQVNNLYFQAKAGFDGGSFTYAAIDNDGAIDITPATFTLNVSSNPAPTTDDATVVIAGPLTNILGLGGNDTAPGTVVSYVITSLPDVLDGKLYRGSVSVANLVSVGQIIPAAQINTLVFERAASFNGGSFSYAAIDNDGASDLTPAIVSLLSASNPVPDTSNASIAVMPNSSTTLTGLTGTDTAPGSVVSYRIVTLPDAVDGVLYFGSVSPGNQVAVGQVIPANQIGSLIFQSTAGFNGGNFTYAAIDNDGASDPTPATYSLTLGNQPPDTNAASGTTTPNSTINLTGLDGSDTDGTIASYVIKTLPPAAQGTLYLGNPASGGTVVNLGDSISSAQISNLYFQASGSFSGTSFTYAAVDDDSVEDATPATVTIGLGNLAPNTNDVNSSTTPDSILNLPGLGGTDSDGTINSYRITSLPPATAGVLYLGHPFDGGTEVNPGDSIPAGQIDTLHFQASGSFNGTSFTYAAVDDDGSEDLTPATVTIGAGNTAPNTTSITRSASPNTTITLTGLGGSDADGSIASYQIKTLPPAAQGTLYLGNPASGGTVITVGTKIPVGQISNLYFQTSGSFSGTSFTYAATDDDGAEDPTPATINLTMVTGNLAPNTNNASNLIQPSSTVKLTGLGGSDPDGSVSAYLIKSLPPVAQGTLYLGSPTGGGQAVKAGQSISAAQISNLYFTASSSFSSASFNYAAIDNAGTEDSTPASVSLRFNNLPPVAADIAVANPIAPNATALLPSLSGSDRDGTITSYTIVSLPEPTQGILYLGNPDANGTVVTAGQVLSVSQISQLFFRAGTSFRGTSFTYTTTDNWGVVDATPATVRLGASAVPPDSVPTPVPVPVPTPVSEDICSREPGLTLKGNRRHNLLDGTEDEDQIMGRRGNDRLYGWGARDRLRGGNGKDRLFGDDCSDLLNGNQGNDRLHGGNGQDRIRGGRGQDRISGDSGNDRITGGQGNDRLWGKQDNDRVNGRRGQDRIFGNEGDDQLRGGRDNDRIKGGQGQDRLRGGRGNDRLTGNLGQDTLRGGQGQDMLRGKSGNDRLWGGRGTDWLGSGRGHDRLDGGAANDTLDGGRGHDTLRGGLHQDKLLGRQKSDWLNGGRGDDLLIGGNGQDVLIGKQNRDTLLGGAQVDRLLGRLGHDVLIGRMGDDVLIGSRGRDFLNGGLGSDRFVYHTVNDGGDRIAQFERTDFIDLHQIFAQPTYASSRPFSRYIKLSSLGASTVVQIDTNGDASGGFKPLVTLQNTPINQVNLNQFIVR